MKPGIIRWVALIAGSGLSVAFVIAGIFIGGSVMSGIVGDASGGSSVIDIVGMLTMFLIPLSVLLAWFRIRTGAYLLTLFAFIHIIVSFAPEIAWMQLAILPVGPLLLYYVSYKKRYEAITETG